MRLLIKHVTHYTYEAPVQYSIQRLRLTPQTYAAQKIETWKLTAPGIASAMLYHDAFGNLVHLIDAANVAGPFDIVAEGIVDVVDAAGVVERLAVPVQDAVCLRQTDATRPSQPMLDLLKGVAPPQGRTLPFVHDLMAAIHSAVAYETGTTQAETTAAQAFPQGRGVCQDHAHVFIGLGRASGLPSRYVTGYLMAGDETLSPAAHAWAEVLVPDLGWVGFDAANLKCPTEHYVRVACGLDAPATAPVRGCRRGGNAEHMSVEVRVEMAQQ